LNFFYQNGGVLCILGGIIYRLNVCFTRKNGAFGLPKLIHLTKILRNIETVSIAEPVQNITENKCNVTVGLPVDYDQVIL